MPRTVGAKTSSTPPQNTEYPGVYYNNIVARRYSTYLDFDKEAPSQSSLIFSPATCPILLAYIWFGVSMATKSFLHIVSVYSRHWKFEFHVGGPHETARLIVILLFTTQSRG